MIPLRAYVLLNLPQTINNKKIFSTKHIFSVKILRENPFDLVRKSRFGKDLVRVRDFSLENSGDWKDEREWKWDIENPWWLFHFPAKRRIQWLSLMTIEGISEGKIYISKLSFLSPLLIISRFKIQDSTIQNFPKLEGISCEVFDDMKTLITKDDEIIL